ncbi:SGNH/GDSL hydrolase family protein [Spiroplasma eriocheiris]|uniref:Lipolytic enzyme, GDSL family n=1 Tax=Spiroplasma eriocheiris TaxID=315358 RepID=A0A0H3XHN2_9MOLU|nr:SGNH/GDSL hydrolase family protein [Spiroplasma eriocheiris]AHF57785.1 putative GDSL family lipase [Spiroplasma eriocheiris CCTCC M 207170]AKM54233.1 lipolytic enzyme, GDSL family [Spiroplasma eriocheiris]
MKKLFIMFYAATLSFGVVGNLVACHPETSHVSPPPSDDTSTIGMDIDTSHAIADSNYSGKFTNFYILGDSLSDSGGIAQVASKILGRSSPVEMDPPFANDSFTNGKVAGKVLSDKLGINLTTGWNFSNYNFQGNNYAIAGATSGEVTDPIQSIILNNFKIYDQTTALIKQHQIKATDLTFLEIGGNDVMQILKATTNLNQDHHDSQEQMIDLAIKNERQALFALVNHQEHHIVVMNVPDIGKIPAFNKDSQKSALATQITKEYNQKLSSVIAEVNAHHPNTVKEYDLFTEFGKLLTTFGTLDPKNNTTDQCVTINFSDIVTGKLTPTYVPGCDDSNINNHFFFDDVHPTAWAHQQVGEQLYQLVANWN